jgi:hypothetical protein
VKALKAEQELGFYNDSSLKNLLVKGITKVVKI